MSLEEFVNGFLSGPDIDKSDKDSIQALMASHLATGMKLQRQGQLREAIAEFAKEHTRPIRSDVDKEIAQKSYWHVGIAYRKLGDLNNAILALEKARELLKLYRIGAGPEEDLAEILIEQGKLDQAIELCQEGLEQVPSWRAKQLLATARMLKEEGSG